MRLRCLPVLMLACALMPAVMIGQQAAGAAGSSSAATQSPVISAADAARILPATVFFRGLSAPVQSRNSGGVRLGEKSLMLVALVDTSGYSTQVKEKYQAYLLTESAIDIGGKRLPAGAYGCGFIGDDTFVVQDIGAHDLFTVKSMRDASLRRPTPLQVVAAPESGSYRLYAGRSFVSFKLAGQ